MELPSLYKYSQSSDIPTWPTRKAGVAKPVAQWLSVEDAWERWCRRESVFSERVAWRRAVSFTADARIKVIDNLSLDFDSFTDRYADPADVEFRVPCWEQVAADLDVLLLWPWQRPPLRRYRWDLTWDCPSGVVFTPEVISYGPPEDRRS